MKEYDLSENFVLNEKYEKSKGWGRRLPHGHQYGNMFLNDFHDDIERMFNIGKADTTQKMNPRTMLEQLRKDYPYRYTLPTETVIRQTISKLFKKQKKEGGRGRRKNTKIGRSYVQKCQEYLREERLLMPRFAWLKLVDDFKKEDGSLPADFPKEDALKRKFSVLKADTKFEEYRQII
mmetsp:Transcript_18656/g.21067  ORF Transcript_18656/g.21067 Transcript_18656/m.21067 type:complete len:178 (+) Transcript_18656:313-846(+)